MADRETKQKESKGKESKGDDGALQLVAPVIMAAKVLWLVLDVATMTIRLLVNTFIYDSPLGKQELAGE